MAEQGLQEKPPLEMRVGVRPPHTGQPNQSHESLASLPGAILNLQRTAGNAAVSELMIQRDDDHSAPAPTKSTAAADEHAKAILAAAQADTPGIEERAVNAVTAIIDTYYPDKKSMVKEVKWVADLDGLMTTAQGKGPKVTGVIKVGEKFITHTTGPNFARHVLQVGHELEHIQQHRDGMGGKKKEPEREFLAFYHEGTATEVPHTGHMGPEMRIRLLNQAIVNYNLFSDDDKKKYEDQYKDLLEQKASYEAKVKPKAKPEKTAGEGE
jgi:hypothetical protein